jgi:hypothetical protein
VLQSKDSLPLSMFSFYSIAHNPLLHDSYRQSVWIPSFSFCGNGYDTTPKYNKDIYISPPKHYRESLVSAEDDLERPRPRLLLRLLLIFTRFLLGERESEESLSESELEEESESEVELSEPESESESEEEELECSVKF